MCARILSRTRGQTGICRRIERYVIIRGDRRGNSGIGFVRGLAARNRFGARYSDYENPHARPAAGRSGRLNVAIMNPQIIRAIKGHRPTLQ
jgi:hypothetical protein